MSSDFSKNGKPPSLAPHTGAPGFGSTAAMREMLTNCSCPRYERQQRRCRTTEIRALARNAADGVWNAARGGSGITAGCSRAVHHPHAALLTDKGADAPPSLSAGQHEQTRSYRCTSDSDMHVVGARTRS